jgi:hypothetical protein
MASDGDLVQLGILELYLPRFLALLGSAVLLRLPEGLSEGPSLSKRRDRLRRAVVCSGS